MTYTIKIEQAHLLKLLAMLETVPMALRDSWPIYECLRQQQNQQDEASAVPIGGDK